MNPARQLVRDLVATITAWNVIAEPRTADAILKPTALVWTPKLARTGYGAGSYVVSTVDLWLLPPSSLKPAQLEDVADDMLATAIELIENTPPVTWTEATREQLEGTHHGWHMVLTVSHQITT